MRPGKRRKLDPDSPEALAEKRKASVRAKVEHPFLKVKRIFGYVKVRYRGLAKNTERLALLFGLGSLLAAEGRSGGVMWAQWAQESWGPPGGPVKGRNGPAGTKWVVGTFGKTARTTPEAGALPRNSPGNHQNIPRQSCSEVP